MTGGSRRGFYAAAIALIGPFLATILAMPMGGFLLGFMNCIPPCTLAERSFIGLVFALATPLFMGFPPRNEGGVGEPFNAWPHIVAVWFTVTAVFFAAALLVMLARKKPRGRSAASVE